MSNTTGRIMKAAIFDMDGTLTDSMRYWRQMNIEYLRSLGIEPTPGQQDDLFSMSDSMVVDYYREHFNLDLDYDKLSERAGEVIRPIYAAGVTVKPGAAAYLARLRARGVKCIVATATPVQLAIIALNKTGLVTNLDYIFSADMIGGHKGEPGFFDRLCALIGEEKEDCVMFEDSLYAMQGARASGLGVIGITDCTNVRDRGAIAAVCDRVIDSFDELE